MTAGFSRRPLGQPLLEAGTAVPPRIRSRVDNACGGALPAAPAARPRDGGGARLPADGTSGRSLVGPVGLRDGSRRSSDRLSPETGCLRPRPGSPRGLRRSAAAIFSLRSENRASARLLRTCWGAAGAIRGMSAGRRAGKKMAQRKRQVSVRYPGDDLRLRTFVPSKRPCILDRQRIFVFHVELAAALCFADPGWLHGSKFPRGFRKRSQAVLDAERNGGRRANIALPVRGHGICLILTQGSNLALLTTKGALATLPRTCGAVFRGAEAEHGQRLALRGTDKVLRAGHRRKAEVVAGVPELTFFGTGVRSGRT